jgi:hypothetical protein
MVPAVANQLRQRHTAAAAAAPAAATTAAPAAAAAAALLLADASANPPIRCHSAAAPKPACVARDALVN